MGKTIFGLLEKTKKQGDCYIWTGATIDGLPTVRLPGGRRASVKKMMLELLGKPKPYQTAIANTTCKCRDCIAPDHLYWSQQINGTTSKVMSPDFERERQRYDPDKYISLPIVRQAQKRVEGHQGNPFAQLLAMAE